MNYWKKEIDNISQWMRAYLKNSGCNGYVLGCSGGLDSSICLSILKRSIPAENIKAIALPCNSNKDSLIDAQKLANNLRIKLEVINLENSFNTIVKNLKSINKNEEISPLVKGNISARLRMVQLYSIANQYNYLVLGTSNKSEILCGYGTKYGDLAIDCDIIGSYYKTEVYKMAEQMPEIPDSIINKKPSADLWENQTDEQELGMPYSQLDKVIPVCLQLKDWMPCYTDLYKITEEQFNKVKKMIIKSEHKNSLPPRYERE